jgi:hypothetical protein
MKKIEREERQKRENEKLAQIAATRQKLEMKKLREQLSKQYHKMHK